MDPEIRETSRVRDMKKEPERGNTRKTLAETERHRDGDRDRERQYQKDASRDGKTQRRIRDRER